MIYPGLKDEQRVKDLIAYLKQFDAAGKKTAVLDGSRFASAPGAMQSK
jgi:cytochrome c